MYKTNIKLKADDGLEYTINCEGAAVRRSGKDKLYSNCVKCKNQVIGDDSGTIWDCNRAQLITDITDDYKHYCVNYVKE